MSAPEYVPRPAVEHPRVYESPPRRLGSWTNDRPGDFVGPQPVGPGLGSPGPDQGYALKLARSFEGQLVLVDGEHEEDAVHGGIAVALKRASLFGRAPVIHDLTVAFSIWGFLGEADPELVALRRSLFEEVHQPHHYLNTRLIADAVPPESLRLTPAQVQQQAGTDWRSLIVEPSAQAADSLLVVDDVSPADLAVPRPPPAPTVEEAPVVEEVAVADVVVDDAPVPATETETEAEPLPTREAEPAPPVSSEPAPPAPVASAPLNTADITELAAEAKRTLRNAPTAPGGPVPGVTPPAPAEVPDEPTARRKAKPVPVPKDAEPDEVARLVADAKQAFRRKPTTETPADDGADAAPGPESTGDPESPDA